MTDRELIEGLARAMGWEVRRWYALTGEALVRRKEGVPSLCWRPTRSLDDIAEVEEEIAKRGLQQSYCRAIAEHLAFDVRALQPNDAFAMVTASARVRALAAAKVLGVV